MTHEHLRMLLPRYAAGTLSTDQVEAVQLHLATGCSTCLDGLYGLPVGKPREPVSPPPVPAAAAAAPPTSTATPAPRRGPSPMVTLAAAAVLIAGALVWRYRVGAERARLATRLTTVEAERVAAAETLEDLASTPGGIQSLALSGAGMASGAHGVAMWNPSRPGLLLIAGGLPPSPTGFTARLTIGSGMSGGHHFDAAPHGNATVAIALANPIGRLQAIEILDDATGQPCLVSRAPLASPPRAGGDRASNPR